MMSIYQIRIVCAREDVILCCGLKFTTPQIESIPRTFGYASLCGDER